MIMKNSSLIFTLFSVLSLLSLNSIAACPNDYKITVHCYTGDTGHQIDLKVPTIYTVASPECAVSDSNLVADGDCTTKDNCPHSYDKNAIDLNKVLNNVCAVHIGLNTADVTKVIVSYGTDWLFGYQDRENYRDCFYLAKDSSGNYNWYKGASSDCSTPSGPPVLLPAPAKKK
jgi:hypothetical protein